MGCESNGSILLCISSCRLGKSWSNLRSMESLPTDVWPLFLQGEMFAVQRIQHGLTSSSNQHLCGMGRIVKVACDKAISLLANSLHSCSQLVHNLTNMINELSKDPTHHLEESNTRIQADRFEMVQFDQL